MLPAKHVATFFCAPANKTDFYDYICITPINPYFFKPIDMHMHGLAVTLHSFILASTCREVRVAHLCQGSIAYIVKVARSLPDASPPFPPTTLFPLHALFMMHRAFAVALIVLAATPPHGAAATTYTAAEVDESCPLTACNGDNDLLAGCVINSY